MRRSERASCLPDPCYSETLSRRQNKLLGKDAVLVAWDNGTCYELGTQGPCPEGFTFKVTVTANRLIFGLSVVKAFTSFGEN